MRNDKLLEAKISKNLFNEIEERVKLGLFSTKSEVVSSALQKAFAEEARSFLRNFTKKLKVTKKVLLSEWKQVRN